MLRVITDIRNRQKSENAGNNDDAELTYKKPIVKIRLNDSENAAEANKKSLQYRWIQGEYKGISVFSKEKNAAPGRRWQFMEGEEIWESF